MAKKGKWIIGGLLAAGTGLGAWLLGRSEARASTQPVARPLPTLPPTQLRPPAFAVPAVQPGPASPKSVVTMEPVKLRRSLVEKWRGVTPPSDILIPRKFNIGDRVTIRTPADQGGPDPLVEGKASPVTGYTWSEIVLIAPDGSRTPALEPGKWGYILGDLKIEGVPVIADASVLQQAVK